MNLITFNFHKQKLAFHSSPALFSSHEVDAGTQFLLRTIMEAGYAAPRSILDLGCGYGPLGLTLKSLYRNAVVHLVDKDGLAVEYTRQNAEINQISDIETYSSLGFDDIHKTDFDLIVSNIPGKAGEPVIAYWLREAAYYLAPGGRAAVVVVTPLEDLVSRTLEGLPGAEIVLRRARPGHTVFHYRFTQPPGERFAGTALERGIYTRRKMMFSLDGLEFTMQTAYGLAEFDSLDYRSEMIIHTIKNLHNSSFRRIALFNPGQGHIPAALWKLLQPENIALLDRDLLALRYSQLNLISNQCPLNQIRISHQIDLAFKDQGKIDLWAGVLREEEGPQAIIQLIQQAALTLSDNGIIVISAGSTAITRIVDYLHLQDLLHLKTREKWRGYGLLVLGHLPSDL